MSVIGVPGSICARTARLLVEVSLQDQPHSRRHCPRCGGDRKFVSSGKFRINAHRKKIDAWLIFRCAVCDCRWNWPIFERRPVATLDPVELDALFRNDPHLADRHAAMAIGRHGETGEDGASANLAIIRTIASPVTEQTLAVEIAIAVPKPCAMRLDRLLALALSLRRNDIRALEKGSALAVMPRSAKPLRRPAIDGQEIRLDLAVCTDAIVERCRQNLSAEGKTVLSAKPEA